MTNAHAKPSPTVIPLNSVQAGQLFVPSKQPNIVCALAFLNGGPPPTPGGPIRIVCVAAEDTRLVGITADQMPLAEVCVVELVERAQYRYAGERA